MTILLRLLPYLIGLGLLVSGWLVIDRKCWTTACKDLRTQNGLLRTQIEYAQKRATELAFLYAKTAQEADDAVRKDRAKRAIQASELGRRLANLPRTPSIAVGADTSSVLQSSTDLANSAPAPIGDKAPTVAISGFSFSEAELASKWAEAALAYLDAKSLHLACVNFYENLRSESALLVDK